MSESPAGDDPVTLTCSSDANPPVLSFSWYHGAACLSADKSFYQARQSAASAPRGDPTLRSTVAVAEDSGPHCCVAQNQHGSQTVSVTLRDPRGENRTIQCSPELFFHDQSSLCFSSAAGGRGVSVGATIGATIVVLLALIGLAVFVVTR